MNELTDPQMLKLVCPVLHQLILKANFISDVGSRVAIHVRVTQNER